MHCATLPDPGLSNAHFNACIVCVLTCSPQCNLPNISQGPRRLRSSIISRQAHGCNKLKPGGAIMAGTKSNPPQVLATSSPDCCNLTTAMSEGWRPTRFLKSRHAMYYCSARIVTELFWTLHTTFGRHILSGCMTQSAPCLNLALHM